jgi:hypothetical protein
MPRKAFQDTDRSTASSLQWGLSVRQDYYPPMPSGLHPLWEAPGTKKGPNRAA